MSKKIYAIVIAYNSDVNIFHNIQSYIDFVDRVYVFDNGNSSFIEDEILNRNLSDRIKYITLNDNLGISAPVNIVANIVLKEGGKWLLTMDQDSVFENFEVIYNYFLNDIDNNIGIYSPAHITGLREYPDEDVSYPFSVMTSGNIVNLDIFMQVGGFDENFFIDRVDHDFCAKLNESGFYIKRINKCRLVHNLGEIDTSHKHEITNHSALRRYYITRNVFYYCEKHIFKNFKHCILYFNNFIFDTKNVFLYEGNRLEKLKYISLGFFHYIIRRKGKL